MINSVLFNKLSQKVVVKDLVVEEFGALPPRPGGLLPQKPSNSARKTSWLHL